MKKFWLTILLILTWFLQTASAQYMVDTSNKNGIKRHISVTSFPDYFPFSELTDSPKGLNTIFNDGLKLFEQEGNYEVEYRRFEKHSEAIQSVRQGKTEILLGAYYSTHQYSGLDFIFPAALNNPIHVFMLPANIDKVKTVEDLKNLKGVYINSEYFSDYMIKNFKNFKIAPIQTPLEAYEKLFVGDIDFVIGSYYFNYAYTLKTGLKDYVAFSKNALWNMPLFISISKASPIFKQLKTTLTKFINTEDFKKSISQSLEQAIHHTEEESRGIVPPKFVRSQSLQELTPADEQIPVKQTVIQSDQQPEQETEQETEQSGEQPQTAEE